MQSTGTSTLEVVALALLALVQLLTLVLHRRGSSSTQTQLRSLQHAQDEVVRVVSKWPPAPAAPSSSAPGDGHTSCGRCGHDYRAHLDPAGGDRLERCYHRHCQCKRWEQRTLVQRVDELELELGARRDTPVDRDSD